MEKLPLTECPNCESHWPEDSQQRRLQTCNRCGYPIHEEDWDADNDDVDFNCCSDCDLVDVCSDANECAIQAGIVKPPLGYGGIF
jgi:hypothetical protein